MKEISENHPPDDAAFEQQKKKKKKDPLYKFTLFANLMAIPALAFYFYVGLNGRINGYFVLLILMLVSEFLFMRRTFKDD